MADNFENNQNNEENENYQNQLNESTKKEGKNFENGGARRFIAKVMPYIIPVLSVFLVIIFIVMIVSSLIHELTLQDGEYRADDWTSIPYAASQFTSKIEVDDEGNLRTSMTAQELWDKMLENNSRVDEFIDGPEDLLKLMNAEITTNYPDTRPNPDEPIDWDTINRGVDSDITQGIVKFKRANSNGSTSTMTYVDPDTFYAWIEIYSETGDESIRNQILSHFTMTKNVSITQGGGNLDYSVNDLVTNISDAIVASAQNTPSPGAGWCEAWAEQVYRNAGLQVPYYATAYDAYKACVISTSMDNIPVGAAVFGTGSGSYAGHVGIYIGNGMVMDNIGNIATSTLEDWVSWQANNPTVLGENPGWLGWGWLCEEPTEIISGNDNSNDSNSEESTDEEQDSDTENSSDVVDKTDMQLITADGKITFYNGDGSAMEGGKLNALGYELTEGQVAMKNLNQYKNSVIYIETSNYGEGSAANGRFFYVTDTGGGLADNQVDVYADIDQATMNAEPYGTYNSGAKIYMVEEDVTYEEYQSKYLNKSIEGQGESEESGANRTKYDVIVATWNETQEIITSNDPDVSEKNETTYTIRTQKINYQDMISKYTMPFNYLWALIVIGQGKEFSLDLADLVYNSQIEFTVYDNLTVTTNVENHDYTRTVTVTTDDGESRTETRHYRTTYTTISRINTLNVSLTRANTWIVDYNQNYTYEVPDNVETNGEPTDDGSGGTITSSNTVEKNNYVSSPANLIEKIDPNASEDNFVTLFRKAENTSITSNIVSGAEWLFEILERNDDTVDMIDLTKYLLYVATGKDYGVTEFDFSIFEPGSFNSISGIYGNTTQEKVWFALRNAGYSEIATAAVMGNIEYESGFDSSLIEYGNGIGFGLCQWSFGRRDALEAYAASKGADASDIQTQIEFLLAELTPGGGANGYASYQMGSTSSSAYDGNSYTVNDWQNATDVSTATVAFMAIFERPSYDPSINHMSGRISAAQKYYNEFQGRTAPTSDDRIGEITLEEPNATKMASMLSEAIRIAEDDRYTYSQANRYGEYQYDCSSFVARLYKEFFNIDVPSTTDGYSTSSSAYVGPIGSVELQPGDVLWGDGHVEIYLGNGLKVGARSARVAIADQIKIDNYSASQFTHVYRFIK